MTRAAQEQFLELIALNPVLREVLHRTRDLQLPDAWIAGGCLFQTAWNVLAGEDPERAIKDYDLFYFDSSDLASESEDDANARAATLLAEVPCRIEVRNQARVHLWYPQEFGVAEYPRLTKTTDGIDHFLAVCCMVGLRKRQDGSLDLYAPLGVDDILSRTMRPNPLFPSAPQTAYEAKAERWRALWPDLFVQPFATTPERMTWTC